MHPDRISKVHKTDEPVRKLNLRSVTGQAIDHYGVKRGIELMGKGGQTIKGDFQVTSCARLVLSVAERARAGNLVVFGPNMTNIITDPKAVANIQRMIPGAPGIDIETLGGQYVLTATETSTAIATLFEGSHVLIRTRRKEA